METSDSTVTTTSNSHMTALRLRSGVARPEEATSSQGSEDRLPNWPSDMIDFITKNFPDGLGYYLDSFHAYASGCWHAVGERQVRRQISEYFGADAKPSKTRRMVDLLKDFLAYEARSIVPDPRMICLSNGTLNTDTFVLEAHSQFHMLQTHTAIDWNPAATCPRWMQFLDEVFTPDDDKVEKIAFVRQWFGYCLVPDNTQHRFLWLVGKGGNGKSVLLSVLTHLVGSANASHLHLDQLKNKFSRAELNGKLINISPEISVKAKTADGYMKALVSGDTVQAERKFKDPFKFRPYVRIIAATNHLPKLEDVSDGFFRRAILLEFNRQFSQDEQDRQLERALVAELSGVLCWAVQGLRELRQKGRFDIPSSSTDALVLYRQESDFEQQFLTQRLVTVTRGGTLPADVYAAYVEFCRSSGFDAKDIITLGKRLVELGVNSRRAGGKKYLLVTIAP